MNNDGMFFRLVENSFSVPSFNDEIIEDLSSFIVNNTKICELLRRLKSQRIGLERLVTFDDVVEISIDSFNLKRLESEELSRRLIYFGAFCNFLIEDQSKKYNFRLNKETVDFILKDYERLIGLLKLSEKMSWQEINNVMSGKKKANEEVEKTKNNIIRILKNSFLFGMYVTFGRNRVSTVYKTMDMMSLPHIEDAKRLKMSPEEYMIKTDVDNLRKINMKDLGVLIDKYGHTTSTRDYKWEERSRERMYLFVYYGWATRESIDGRDCVALTESGKNIIEKYLALRTFILKHYHARNEKEETEIIFGEEKRSPFNKFMKKESLKNFVKNQKESQKIRKSILVMVSELNEMVAKGLVEFKITNPYHSTMVHKNFHSKTFLVLLRTLYFLKKCSLKELAPLILQFKDERKTDVYIELLKFLRNNRKFFNTLYEMNKKALGYRWSEVGGEITTITGTLESYVLDIAEDFGLISKDKDNYMLTNLGESILFETEKTKKEILCMSPATIKKEIIEIAVIDKIKPNDIPRKLNYRTFTKYKKENFLFYHFQDLVYSAINYAFPNKFMPWEFSNFEWNLERAKEAVKWMIEKKLKYTDYEIKNKVSVKTFIDCGLLNMFLKIFKGYVSVAIIYTYPEKKFKDKDFRYPAIYLELGLIFQKILKRIFEAIGYTEGKDFIYNRKYDGCAHKRKCIPYFQFKDGGSWGNKWVDAKYSDFTIFSAGIETIRYTEHCKKLEIIFAKGEGGIEFVKELFNLESEGLFKLDKSKVSIVPVDIFFEKLKKLGREDLIKDILLIRKEIKPDKEEYKPTEYDRKMLAEEAANIEDEIEGKI